MPVQPRILAFAGSARKNSFNRRLIQIAAEGARKAGGEVTLIELGEYPLPIFDQDAEAATGLPENAKSLKKLFLENDGLLLACPEYNSSITPLLKNVIDWVSRKESPEEPPLSAYEGKYAGLLAASPGALGGLRGLVHVHSILENIRVTCIPDQLAVGKAAEAFDDYGLLKDPGQQSKAEEIGAKLVRVLEKVKA
jgi:NAD(P)H-dependent FMN reductase